MTNQQYKIAVESLAEFRVVQKEEWIGFEMAKTKKTANEHLARYEAAIYQFEKTATILSNVLGTSKTLLAMDAKEYAWEHYAVHPEFV